MSLKLIKAQSSDLVQQYDNLEEELKNIDDQVANNRITEEVALEQKTEVNRAISDLIAKVDESFAQINKNYQEKATIWGALKGKDLTEDSKLFESGVVLNEVQYEAMVEQYKGNSTMLNLIYNHAIKNEVEINTSYALTAEEKVANFLEISKAFQDAVLLYMRGDNMRYAILAGQESFEKDISL